MSMTAMVKLTPYDADKLAEVLAARYRTPEEAHKAMKPFGVKPKQIELSTDADPDCTAPYQIVDYPSALREALDMAEQFAASLGQTNMSDAADMAEPGTGVVSPTAFAGVLEDGEAVAWAFGDADSPDGTGLEPADYGLTDDVEAEILALGDVIGASKVKPKKPRRTAAATAWESVKAGIFPLPIKIESEANARQWQRHFDAVYADAVKDATLGGSRLAGWQIEPKNTYYRRLGDFRDALAAAVEAGLKPSTTTEKEAA